MRVLVVDRDRASLTGLTTLLKGDGVDAVGIQGLPEAVDALRHDTYDAVVATVDGRRGHEFDVVRAARATQPEAAVIVVTGEPYGALVTKTPADMTLGKPLDYGALLQTLRDRA